MTPRRSYGLAVGLATLLASSQPAFAVGVEGDPAANARVGLGLGAGADEVGGYAQDLYPFVELYGHAETRLLHGLYLGAAGSYRQDVENRNHARADWTGEQSPAVALQALIGYDGPSLHISAGPWLYGASRRRPDFRMGFLPFGLLRVRVGSLASWRGVFQIGEGAPFTAAGGGYAVRFLVGAPALGAHRLTGGLYSTLGEKTLGLTAFDELARGTAAYGWRFGGLVGTNVDSPGQLEGSVFAGLVW